MKYHVSTNSKTTLYSRLLPARPFRNDCFPNVDYPADISHLTIDQTTLPNYFFTDVLLLTVIQQR